MNILFQMSGSISCYKSCELISRLVKESHQVKVVATEDALKFVGEATLEGLTGEPVIKSSFQSGSMMNHIELSRWCDKAILCPATAHTINGLRYGVLKNTIGDIFLAFPFETKPFYIVPSMNSYMLSHPTVQESLNFLKLSRGVHVLPTGEGQLACGEKGYGRLLETEEIYKRIFSQSNHLKPAKILITGGPTEESIDDVRCITNKSTGKTAIFLAHCFQDEGCDVTFLKNSQLPSSVSHEVPFQSFQDLDQNLKRLLETQSFDFILHLAAVSDYSLENPLTGQKISSQSEFLQISLKKNKKILNELKNYSRNKNIKVVGFKLTSHSDGFEQVQKIFSQGSVDYVVHNDLSLISDQKHFFSVYDPHKKLSQGKTKKELFQGLKSIVDSFSSQSRFFETTI